MHRLSRRGQWLTRTIAGTAVIVLTMTALGGGARAESLVEALALTYENNPTLRAARARLRATNEQVPQEAGNWRPQVTVSGSIGKQKIQDEDRGFSLNETTTPGSAQLQVRQPIYRGGQTIAGVERATNQVLSERERLANTEQDVLQRAVEAYLNVWRDEEILRLSEENVKNLEEQLRGARARFERGVVTRTDVAQARSRLARARARRENAQGQLTASIAAYEEVVGQPPGELSFPGQAAELPASRKATIGRAVEDNPEVRGALFAGKAAERQVRQVVGQLLPTLTVDGTLSHREETSSQTETTDRAQVTLQLQVPLYQQGIVTSRVREAKQTASQRRIEISEAKRRVRQEALSAWAQLESARTSIEQVRQEVEAARVALTGMEEEHRVGSRTVIDVLDAEQDLFNAQISLVRARRDLAVAGYGVLSAVGRLTARDLGLDVQYYDPVSDFEAVRGLWWSVEAPGAEAAAAPAGGDPTLLEIERLLAALDFRPGTIDGRMDSVTRAAIGRFQEAAGLAVTRAADAALLEELRAVAGALKQERDAAGRNGAAE